MDPRRVCLYCWRVSNGIVVEDEAHIAADCRAYAPERADLMRALSNDILRGMDSLGAQARLLRLLSSASRQDWEAIGQFFARVRQKRRSYRRLCEADQSKLEGSCFEVRKAAWTAAGKLVCRHGIFFLSTRVMACRCMERTDDERGKWLGAKYMPQLDVALKVIVVVPFNATHVKRIGEIRAELRRRDW